MKSKINRLQKTVKLGKTKYIIIYGIILWGIPVGLMYGFIFPIFEHRNIELTNIIVGLTVFPLYGIVYGLVTWRNLINKIESMKKKNKTNWRDFIVNSNNEKFELGLIWSKANSVQQIAQEIVQLIANEDYDYIACVETKGIIYAAAVSAICGKEIRIFIKNNKITYTKDKYERKFINWKNIEDGIEIEKNQLSAEDKMLVIDDIVDTGITFKNLNSIVKEANGKIIKYICIKNISPITEIDNVQIMELF